MSIFSLYMYVSLHSGHWWKWNDWMHESMVPTKQEQIKHGHVSFSVQLEELKISLANVCQNWISSLHTELI